MKQFILAWLKGAAIGGLSAITMVKYYEGIKDVYPKWLSMPTSGFVGAGLCISGLEVSKAIEHYIRENEL